MTSPPRRWSASVSACGAQPPRRQRHRPCLMRLLDLPRLLGLLPLLGLSPLLELPRLLDLPRLPNRTPLLALPRLLGLLRLLRLLRRAGLELLSLPRLRSAGANR